MDKQLTLGQLRSDKKTEYIKPYTYGINLSDPATDFVIIDKKVTIAGKETNFIDKSFKMKNNFFQDSYYIFCQIKKINTVQNITIYAENSLEEDRGDKQQIRAYEIDKTEKDNDYYTIEFIFTPEKKFDSITFELARTPDDYATEGRVLNFKLDTLLLSKIVNVLSLNSSLGALEKVGIQAPPGLLMCINGEEIRVGRSGLYEMAYDIVIESIGFILRPNDTKYFIMDYQK